jgi:hypothetical protein
MLLFVGKYTLRLISPLSNLFNSSCVPYTYISCRAWRKRRSNLNICTTCIRAEIRSRDSAVGIAIGYGLDDRGFGVRVTVGSRIFSSPRRPDRLWGPPHPMCTGDSFPGVKRSRREADHSLLASAKVKKMWIDTSTPPYAFRA